MQSADLHKEYVKGKQTICLFATIISMAGYILDAVSYASIYSTEQWYLQIITFIVFVFALILLLIDRDRNTVLAFQLLSYGFIINLLFTTLYIHTFIVFTNFSKANILARDVLFFIFYLVLSGFIIGRKHIIIQGSLLFGLILYFIFYLKESFFVSNAPVYLIAVISFSGVLYFFVKSINSLIDGLGSANAINLNLKKEEASKKQALIEFQNSLIDIGKDDTLLNTDLNHLFKRICLTAARDLKTSRVSIWTLDEANTKLIRRHLFETSGTNDERIVLDRKYFPQYFNALESKAVIAAIKAETHPDTSEFANAYLKPQSIKSMLDCPIIMDGQTIGVICCEHQHEVKYWSSEEILFVQSLSVHISICYKNLEIKNLLSQVNLRNHELIEKTHEIEAINEELSSLNEELKTLNETLEEKIKMRTSELATRNIQLTEYAFINSHILRAPLARVLGLSNIIATESISIKDRVILEALIKSSNELDLIIRKISDLLYDGNNLSREDIQAIIDRRINAID